MRKRAIKVLIIDDSALVRNILSQFLTRDKEINVIGTASDPIIAIQKIKEEKPDVITLDLEMPRMDGLTFLEKLMAIYPIPVVVISSLAQEGSKVAIKALELGAVDFVAKPKVGLSQGLEELEKDIVTKVKGAAQINMDEIRKTIRHSRMEKLRDNKVINGSQTVSTAPLVQTTDKLIMLGASTGGTIAVKSILQKLPSNLPGIVVVLHMPPNFTRAYAESLDKALNLRVKEAVHNDKVLNGYVYIAPGGYHLTVNKNTEGNIIKLDQEPPIRLHRPSIDKAFFSLAQIGGANSLGIILTGMGDDGARGIKAISQGGGATIAQDEKSCVVFGMPKQAISLGGVKKVLSLEAIAEEIVNFVQK